uniref:Ribonuclease R n=1 Tax=mine drainage metagenome TaxID=410659 RepID=E6PYJ0_9ZZZZ
MDDRELLRHIERSAGQKAGYKQLVRELGLGGGRERRELLEQLERLTGVGQLVSVDREHWMIRATSVASSPAAKSRALGTRENLVAGRIDLHRDGFGFVRPNRAPGTVAPDEDIFIPPTEINSAMHGDQVLVEVGPTKPDGRRMGRVARVLERRNPTVVGVFHYARKGRRGAWIPGTQPGHLVTPFDSRMSQPILIPEGEELPAATPDTTHRVLGDEALTAAHFDDLEGLVVDVEITAWPTATRPAVGRVVEVLGHPDDFGVDVEMMVRKHQLPRIFPENVLAEARSVAVLDAAEVARREDFRALPIVTIDGETARDFDDAVLVRRFSAAEGGGWELQVHIADVAQYVRPATDLDLEARLRGTSVYFPDRAIPMLPHELSTGICSLKPDEDRLVLSCLMRLDEDARIESFRVTEGVIRSAARMTYTQVHKILEGDAETRAQFAVLTPAFEAMRELAGRMNARRSERGSIDFDLPEPVIEFDGQGQMQGVARAERTWANRLIEEFMLAANECVATWLEDLGVPSLYRIHEQPDPRRVVDFEDAAAAFGYSLGLGALPVKRFQPRGERREQQRRGGNQRDARAVEVPEHIDVTPRMYQKLSARISGKPEERILSYLMLRSLKQARYSEVNEGHFALAAPSYTHFTSPIRRYPDLIVHRIAKALLGAGAPAGVTLAADRHRSPWTHPNETDGNDSHPNPTNGARAASAMRGWTGEPPIPLAELAAIALETSQTERRAAEAERELIEWKKVRFMEDRVGEEFDAMILNPAKFGLFVELKDMFVEGLVPIETLPGDRFSYRENTREIIGAHTGIRYRAGDQVRVVLDRVLAFERKLQFAIIDATLTPALKSSGKKAGKAKVLAKASPAKPGFRPPKDTTRPAGRRKFKAKGRRRK